MKQRTEGEGRGEGFRGVRDEAKETSESNFVLKMDEALTAGGKRELVNS